MCFGGFAMHLGGVCMHLGGVGMHFGGVGMHLDGIGMHSGGVCMHLDGIEMHSDGIEMHLDWATAGNGVKRGAGLTPPFYLRFFSLDKLHRCGYFAVCRRCARAFFQSL